MNSVKAAAAILSAVIIQTDSSVAQPTTLVSELQPSAPVEMDMTGGDVHTFEIRLEGFRYWRINVDQDGIDVAVEATYPIGRTVGPTSTPVDRDANESLLLSDVSPGVYRITVRTIEQFVMPGRYTIDVRPILNTTNLDLRLNAELTMLRAGTAYFQGTSETRQEALQEYVGAAPLWRDLGLSAEQALALFSAATLRDQMDDRSDAIHYLQSALALYRQNGDRSMEANTLNTLGVVAWEMGQTAQAREHLDDSANAYADTEDEYGAAVVANNLCLIELSRGRLQAAHSCFPPVVATLERLGELRQLGTALNNLGGVYFQMGEPGLARTSFERALQLRRQTEDRAGEIATLNNIAMLYRAIGEIQEALYLYQELLTMTREDTDIRGQARTLNAIGYTYFRLAEPHTALTFLEQALPLRRKAKDNRGIAVTLNNIGSVYSSLGDWDTALINRQDALTIRQKLDDEYGEALVRIRIGHDYLAAARPGPALDEFEKALRLLEDIPDRRRRAEALEGKGRVLAASDRLDDAEKHLIEAIDLRRLLHDKPGEARALHALATLDMQRGDADAAERHLALAIEAVEASRVGILAPELRMAFGAAQKGIFDQYVELLMTRHRKNPSGGYERQALEMSERGTMRGLIESITELNIDVLSDAPSELVLKHRAVRQKLNALAALQDRVGRRTSANQRLKYLDTRIDLAIAELNVLNGQIRSASSYVAAMQNPRPLSDSETQALLDEKTLLLHYSLGNERSYLWVVSANVVKSYELAGRSSIDRAVRVVHKNLRSLDPLSRDTDDLDSRQLAGILLGPIQDQLTNQRLIIIADGALHFLPFGALPMPGTDGREILIENHEITYIPSATVLAAQRKYFRKRAPASRTIAIVADPVVDRRDRRLAGATSSNTANPNIFATRSAANRSFSRIKGTKKELDVAVSGLPDSQILKLTGFDANRDTLLTSPLHEFKFLHFATHAYVDAEHPALSALFLSQFDRRGKPIDGSLRLHDVYSLRLSADLVVLSACETALGKAVRGEGLIGLSRGFMYAGSRRVLASLWQVPDDATARLMRVFYELTKSQGRSPSAALREAKLQLRDTHTYSDPYYWAAFVIQGDWR